MIVDNECLQPQKYISHYTSFENMKSIIEKKCFWAFTAISQEDKSEINYGINCILGAKNNK